MLLWVLREVSFSHWLSGSVLFCIEFLLGYFGIDVLRLEEFGLRRIVYIFGTSFGL